MYNPYSKKLQKEDNVDVNKIYHGYYGAAHMKILLKTCVNFIQTWVNVTLLLDIHVYGPHDKFSLEKFCLAGTINSTFLEKK